MAYQGIGTGTTPNDGTGDDLLSGAIKINSNFQEIYDALGDGSNINFNQNTTITAGDGLTGGGDLTANRTFNVGAGDGISVAADSVAVNSTVVGTSGDQTIGGILTATTFVGNGTIPIGGIIMWSGSVASIPTGWALCNGGNGTPDLQDRFIVGAGSGYAVGATGGDATVTLNINQIPSHNHGGLTTENGSHTHGTSTGQQWAMRNTPGLDSAYGGNGIGQGDMQPAGNHQHGIPAQGGGQAHENRPPYYALAFIMRTA